MLSNEKFEKTGHPLKNCGPSCIAGAPFTFVAFLIRKSDNKMIKLGVAEMCNPNEEDDYDSGSFSYRLHAELQLLVSISIGYRRQPGYCPKYHDNPYRHPEPQGHTTLTYLNISMQSTDDYGVGEPNTLAVQNPNQLFGFLAGIGSSLFL